MGPVPPTRGWQLVDVGPMTPATARTNDAKLSDFVVVANRLPVHQVEGERGASWPPSPGGLVSALTPVLRETSGIWVGWPGGACDPVSIPGEVDGIGLRAVALSEAECDGFYTGFSNATLWPLYHDAVRTPTFDRSWWNTYRDVNARFAEVAADSAAAGAAVWVHDYQLQLVPAMLRKLRPDVRIGFFLHIPFPPRELFMQLPWRTEIIEGILGADLIGFQVPGAATNFSRLARRLLGVTGTETSLEVGSRRVGLGAFPISVDTQQIMQQACQPDVRARARQIRLDLGNPEIVLLGVDRLDYTKGIDRRMLALGRLFEDGVLHSDRHVMIQIAVPSRELDPHYQQERHRLEQLVSEINGQHSSVGHPAIHYLNQSVPNRELIALYLAADIMLVTPLRDGMNLVAKEYVAARAGLAGKLILSEFAGAAAELKGATLINPHDIDGIADAIRRSLARDQLADKQVMQRLHRIVRRKNVHLWSASFLAALNDAALPQGLLKTS